MFDNFTYTASAAASLLALVEMQTTPSPRFNERRRLPSAGRLSPFSASQGVRHECYPAGGSFHVEGPDSYFASNPDPSSVPDFSFFQLQSHGGDPTLPPSPNGDHGVGPQSSHEGGVTVTFIDPTFPTFRRTRSSPPRISTRTGRAASRNTAPQCRTPVRP